jgi:tetratricopeptide (TPR) repeat protein
MTADPVPVPSHIIALLEKEPLDPALWRELTARVRAEGDTQGVTSLEVILHGVEELKDAADMARSRNQRPPASSPLAPPLFSRLAVSYNDARLLKEAGMLYLSTWRLPEVAREHFERCLRLGEPEKDLRPLIEAAAIAVQRMAAARTCQKPTHSGVSGTHYASPVVVDVMRHAGLSRPSRVQPAVGGTETMADELSNEAPLPKSSLECLREAPDMIAQGRLARAKALLLRAGDNPRHGREAGQAWASLGKAYYDAGSFPEMEMAYQEASKSEPETMVAQFNLALAKQLNRKYDQAEALYLTADRIQPNHPKVWCNLGSLYFQSGRYTAAEDALRRALRADSDYARAWDNLASALGAQNKLDASLEACQQAIALRPGYPEAYFKMGVIHFGRNRPAEASEAFRHATELPELAPFAFSFLGTIHARLEQTGPATLAIQQAVEIDPKCDLLWMAWNELGKAHYALGASRNAAEAFAKATEVKPGEAEGWFNLGLARQVSGAREEARECYLKTVQLDEKFHLAWHNLGIVCADLKRQAEATRAFQSEVGLKPDNARAWYDLGVSLESEGREAEAAKAFAQAEALDHPQAANAA